ncbi:hypothetical protein H2199_003553 [Coniosporium tulheliwenetii]|uniref:Uncharacterized protein n=1 Tax=Coniosporium tulheliwenetii TaxID=3383036 RepID=A0ACC2ZBA6_9PEZI|nr:hypothetical protein H2199_003553 [Cladosporium sp. JES 115]
MKRMIHTDTLGRSDVEVSRLGSAVDHSDSAMDRLGEAVALMDAIMGCSDRAGRSDSVAVLSDGHNHLDTTVGRSGEVEGHSDDRGHSIGMVGYTDREGRMESMDRTDRAPGVQREHGSKTSWHTFAVVMAVSEATMAFLCMA